MLPVPDLAGLGVVPRTELVEDAVEASGLVLRGFLRQETAEHCVVLYQQHRLLTRLPQIHEIFGLGGGRQLVFANPSASQ